MRIVPARVLRLALQLQAVSLAVIGAGLAAVAWHHLRIASPCEAPPAGVEAVACLHRTLVFAVGWFELAALLLLHFCVCCAIAWIVAARRRPRPLD